MDRNLVYRGKDRLPQAQKLAHGKDAEDSVQGHEEERRDGRCQVGLAHPGISFAGQMEIFSGFDLCGGCVAIRTSYNYNKSI